MKSKTIFLDFNLCSIHIIVRRIQKLQLFLYKAENLLTIYYTVCNICGIFSHKVLILAFKELIYSNHMNNIHKGIKKEKNT